MASMTLDSDFKSIQVFPVHKNTINGIQTDLDVTNYKLLHVLMGEVGDENAITLTFEDNSTLIVNLIQGMDIGINDVVTLTTSKEVLVS